MFLFIGVFKFFTRKKKQFPSYELKLKHFKYSVYIIFAFLLLLDLSLRFITPKYRSYSENNYGWFYISPFSDRFSDLKNQYYYGSSTSEKYTHAANSSIIFETADFTIEHKYNELGLRERENIPALIKDRKVILTIGDSFTEGVGTSQDSTWQRQLENRLNDSLSNEYVVVNAGISGSDPILEYHLLNQLLKSIQPDYVVISISSYDLLDILESGGQDFKLKERKQEMNQPFGYYLYSWSYLFRAVSTLIYDYPEIFMNQDEFDREIQKAASQTIEIIHEITSIGLKKNFKTIVVFFPLKDEMIKYNYNFDAFNNIIKSLNSNDEIFTVDILDFYRQNKNSFIIPPEMLYWPHDGHMTSLGYQIWSDILFTDLSINEVLEKNQ